jgi:hypothetical protein
MPRVPSAAELEDFFEEVWHLAELAAATEDRHLVSHLVGLSEEIVAWRNELSGGVFATAVVGLDPPPISDPRISQQTATAEDRNADGMASILNEMEERLSRQRVIVSRLERGGGSRQSVELARELLQLLQNSVAITRRNLWVLETSRQHPQVWHGILTRAPANLVLV